MLLFLGHAAGLIGLRGLLASVALIAIVNLTLLAAFKLKIHQRLADPAEPLNLELVYVYVADEFPRPDRVPTEPGTATIERWRAPPTAIPACR